jgi:hypothetical protein
MFITGILLKEIEFKLYLQNNNISEAYKVYNEVIR